MTITDPPTLESESVSRPSPFRIRRIAVGMLVAAIVLRATVLSQGFLYWDDFILAGRAARLSPLSMDYLFYNHDGHFMPGAFALEWVIVHFSELNYAVVVVALLLGQLAVWWLFLRLLERHFGSQPRILIPFALILFSCLALPPNTWWAAALNNIPLQLGLVITCDCVLRIRRGEPTPFRLFFVGFIGALLFFEKSLLIPWAAFGLAVALSNGSLRHRIASAWALSRRLWITSVGVSIAWIGLYIWFSEGRGIASPSFSGAFEMFRSGLVATASTLVGGPWKWEPAGYGSGYADPPAVGVFFTLALVALGVLLTSRRSGNVKWVWLWAWAYVVIELAAVIVTRLQPDVTVLIAATLRYTGDAIVPLSLAVAIALMPKPVATTAPMPTSRLPRFLQSANMRLALTLVSVTVFAIGVFTSTLGWAQILHRNAARPYVENATAALAAADPAIPFLPQTVPQTVLYPLAFPYNQTDWLFAPLRNRPSFGSSTSRLQVITDHGHLSDAHIKGLNNKPAPAADKGSLCTKYQINPGQQLDVQLESTAVEWEHIVGIGYLAHNGVISVQLGDGQPATAAIKNGIGVVYITVVGGSDMVHLRLDNPKESACISSVQVGSAIANLDPKDAGLPDWVTQR